MWNLPGFDYRIMLLNVFYDNKSFFYSGLTVINIVMASITSIDHLALAKSAMTNTFTFFYLLQKRAPRHKSKTRYETD